MVDTVIAFALVTALFEAAILRFVPLKALRHPVMKVLIHSVVFTVNIWVHFGTIVGTMTAITSALVSFGVLPAIIWCKAYAVARAELLEKKKKRTLAMRALL